MDFHFIMGQLLIFSLIWLCILYVHGSPKLLIINVTGSEAKLMSVVWLTCATLGGTYIFWVRNTYHPQLL